MTSISESTLSHTHIPQLYCVVHTTRNQEVSGVMPVDLPDWLTMFNECVSALCLHEVPYFNSPITGACSE